MKLDFDYKILDLEGKPIKDGEKDTTLCSVVCAAMLATVPGDDQLPADDKVKMFRLAQTAMKHGVQDVPIEDVAFLKKRIGKLFGALIVGRVFDLLEQKENDNVEKKAD